MVDDTKESLEHNTSEVRKITILGLFVNFFLTILKIVIGLFGKSSSVVADGFHSLSDCSTDIAVIIGVKYWNKEPDEDHPYGHRRIEAMVSSFIAIALASVGFFLIYESITKIHNAVYNNGIYQIPEWSTFWIAIISIITKEILYHKTARKAVELKSTSLLANAWHHRSDAFSSIPVALAIGFTKYNESWAILDPIASVVVSFFILQAAYMISKPALLELSDSGASEISVAKIKEIATSVEGVQSVHGIRTRYHGNGLHVDLHIQVDPDLTVREGHEIAGHAKRHLLEDGPEVIDVLVHLEPGEPRKENKNV